MSSPESPEQSHLENLKQVVELWATAFNNAITAEARGDDDQSKRLEGVAKEAFEKIHRIFMEQVRKRGAEALSDFYKLDNLTELAIGSRMYLKGALIGQTLDDLKTTESQLVHRLNKYKIGCLLLTKSQGAL